MVPEDDLDSATVVAAGDINDADATGNTNAGMRRLESKVEWANPVRGCVW